LEFEEPPPVPLFELKGSRLQRWTEEEAEYIVDFSKWMSKQHPYEGFKDFFVRLHQLLPHRTEGALYTYLTKYKRVQHLTSLGYEHEHLKLFNQQPGSSKMTTILQRISQKVDSKSNQGKTSSNEDDYDYESEDEEDGDDQKDSMKDDLVQWMDSMAIQRQITLAKQVDQFA